MMRRCVSLLVLAACCAAVFPLTFARAQTVIDVTDTVLVPNVKRFGINVGSRSWWGASQFMKNLIDNPGFEAGEYGSVVLVESGATGTRVPELFWDTGWNNDQNGVGWPLGFWNGAEYEIVYGSAKGRRGTVNSFLHENGKNVFVLNDTGTAPERMSVLFARRTVPGLNGNTSRVDATAVRPGSPGSQSLVLAGNNSRYSFYMDSLYRDGDQSAGKLLVIRGAYDLSLWVKGNRQGAQVRIRFFREGEANFFDETVSLTKEWQHVARSFNVQAGADPYRTYPQGQYRPILGFTVEALGGDSVWVDDVSLVNTENDNPTAFTNTFVQKLKEYRPGILRHWGGQLGSTLDNQLAEPFARKTVGYTPRSRTPADYPFSLHEFLELCKEVGAEPWYVIPPTFSAADLLGLMEYLGGADVPANPRAAKRSQLGQVEPWTTVFPTIHLEFGNEMWGSGDANDPFMGSSVNGGVRLGAIANDRFGILKTSPHFDAQRFHCITGGQAGYPGRQREIQENGANQTHVALAPYFGVLDTWANDEDIFGPLFAGAFYEAAAGGMKESVGYLRTAGSPSKPAIYELNFHTTHGSSPIDVRNDFVTSLGGGLALPFTMLTYQRELGVIDQCAFSALGYSFRLSNGDMVRLWGMLRDLEATGRKRPTWLGVEVANKAIAGDAVKVNMAGNDSGWLQAPINGVGQATWVPYVHAFAFAQRPDTGRWSRLGIALFNFDLLRSRDVTITHRMGILSDVSRRYTLAAPSVHHDNEDSVTVEPIDEPVQNPDLRFTLPPHSLTVLALETSALDAGDPPPAAATALNISFPSPAAHLPEAVVIHAAPGVFQVALFNGVGKRIAEGFGEADGSGRTFFSLARLGPAPTPGVYFVALTQGVQRVVKPLVIAR